MIINRSWTQSLHLIDRAVPSTARTAQRFNAVIPNGGDGVHRLGVIGLVRKVADKGVLACSNRVDETRVRHIL